MTSYFATFLLMMSASGPTDSAPAGSDATSQPDYGDAEYVDEIEVFGQMTTVQLGKLVVEARLDFWELYNSMNTVDEFRVVCDRRAPTGSNLKKLSCMPMYYSEKATELTWQRSLLYMRAERGIGLRTPNQRNFVNMTKRKKKEADAHMIALIEDNPALREKYEFLLEANAAYERSKRPE